MIPIQPELAGKGPSAPRASGDDPSTIYAMGTDFGVLPARAGMIPSRRSGTPARCRAPRASGDDPDEVGFIAEEVLCSPRERG